MSDEFKRYLISSGVTFATGFLGAVLVQLEMGLLTAANLSWGAVAAIGLVGLRAGVKALTETVVIPAGEKIAGAFAKKK